MSGAALTGGCYCGAVRFEVTAAPLMRAQCHCRPCQYFTGGGPNYFFVVPADGFRYTKGAPRRFARTDIETPRTREFCPTCGVHLTTIRPNGDVVVKVGALDDPAAYEGPAMAIHTRGKQPFHAIPDDLPAHEDLPK